MRFLLTGLFALVLLTGGASQQMTPAKARVAGPELVGTKWLNTEKPVTLKSRQGKVTVVHFWTFACSNCIANLPAYDRLYGRFAKDGVEFIGVHTPELAVEKVDSNVADAVKKRGMKYPILIDTDGANWSNWHQRLWPTVYVLDKSGKVAFYWEGELAWRGASGEAQVSNAIARALKE